MKAFLLSKVTKFAGYFGVLLLRRNVNNDPTMQIERMLECESISVIIDVGANEGQFASGYILNPKIRRIISFEPLTDAFKVLGQRSSKFDNWDAHQVAVGNQSGETTINVSMNSVSSSVRQLTDVHVGAAPNSECVKTELVNLRTLDSVLKDYFDVLERGNIMLKIDTQGYEREVLEGAKETLSKTKIVLVEVSFEVLYAGQALFEEIHSEMSSAGYKVYNIIPGLTDNHTGRLLQADFIYRKS